MFRKSVEKNQVSLIYDKNKGHFIRRTTHIYLRRLITRPEESYRVWCVWVWSWILVKKEALVHWGCCVIVKKCTYMISRSVLLK